MDTTGERRRTYLPAAGHDWFLPLYDPLVQLIGGDEARQALLDQASIRPNERMLDLGCGTGTFVVLIKQLHPGVEVVGIDPDPKALARAGEKAKRAGLSIQLDRGFSDQLPYADASFDRVFSAFMFHHLAEGEQTATMREVRRVLKPGGSLHLLDFSAPDAGATSFVSRLFHSHGRMAANSRDQILAYMNEAGLADPKEVGRRSMLFMWIAYYRAAAPERPTL
jgi:ubiquinone/menaquinone biosynthesis C-methylase UbiE